MSKVIFHIDMNCFFASCEIAENPSLKGKKMCVAHKSLDQKGMVLTASYEAKRLGVKTTWPVFKALQVCPDIIVVEPHFETYQKYSRMFFNYFYSLTPFVEPASIDEAYLDVTNLASGDGYLELAKKIQDTLLNQYKLPCSIGIASNKFLAKMASDMKKPLGITVLRKKDIPELMYPLPIEDFFGCGKKSSEALRLIGINTIGDLAAYPEDKLEKYIGKNACDYFKKHVNGEGNDIVDPNAWNGWQSMSNDHTLNHPEFSDSVLLNEIKQLVYRLEGRLIKDKYECRNISVVLKFADFTTISKSITVKSPIYKAEDIMHHCTGLFHTLFTGEKGVRMVSVHLGKLTKKDDKKYQQLSIFDVLDDVSKDKKIDDLLKRINNLVGKDSIRKGL